MSCSLSKASEQQTDFSEALISFYVFIKMVEFFKVCISSVQSKPSSFVTVDLKLEIIRFPIA